MAVSAYLIRVSTSSEWSGKIEMPTLVVVKSAFSPSSHRSCRALISFFATIVASFSDVMYGSRTIN
jgi:hypothetical protein